jgi:hypothetical protein
MTRKRADSIGSVRADRIGLGMGKRKAEAARSPHTGAGGAQALKGAQREPRGIPEETLLSKGTQKTPKRAPDARQNAQMAPNPEMHLSENVPFLTPSTSSSPSSSTESGRVVGGYLPW